MRTRICYLIIGFVVASAGKAPAQTIPDIARTSPTKPIVRGLLVDIRTAPLETLAEEATLVVVGRLHQDRSYLTPNEMDILTDYRIQPDRILAGTLPVTRNAPSPSATPTLTMYGGTVVIEGVSVATVDYSIELPLSGGSYLMFLRPFGKDIGRYQLVRGGLFEFQAGRMRALLKRAETSTPYKELTDLPVSIAVEEIARRVRR